MVRWGDEGRRATVGRVSVGGEAYRVRCLEMVRW